MNGTTTDPHEKNPTARPTLRPTNRNLPLFRIRRQNPDDHRWWLPARRLRTGATVRE
jgi:hypothetical protein